jgi:uncharacterized protein YndB with AHSA1/START domain
VTTPDVPMRMERNYELPGTPEQVWAAIATSAGISSWFLRTDVEEREGGSIVAHMGEGADSTGTVTGWDPPHRFAYEEPDWAALAGHEGAPVTPLVTEFLIEARSGGTCVLKLVSSAFGTGADWENEFFTDMQKGWLPFFDNLRLYLTHFPGQRATPLAVSLEVARPLDDAWDMVRRAVGAEQVGQALKVNGVAGELERLSSSPDANELLIRLTDPVPGYLGVYAFGGRDGPATVSVQGWLFSDVAQSYVEREQPGWQAWLDSLGIAAA